MPAGNKSLLLCASWVQQRLTSKDHTYVSNSLVHRVHAKADLFVQAMALIAAAQDPSASHNCFAYKLEEEIRSSDDGEPGGTAGKPILSAITGEGLDGVCVLITRSASPSLRWLLS